MRATCLARGSRGTGTFALIVMICLAVAGCGPGQWEQSASDRAVSFYEAVATSDGEAACAVLTDEARRALESASGRQCAQALPGLDLRGGSVVSVEVWGTEARVALEQDVVFLGRFPSGWEISAAGCTPAPAAFDCTLGG